LLSFGGRKPGIRLEYGIFRTSGKDDASGQRGSIGGNVEMLRAIDQQFEKNGPTGRHDKIDTSRKSFFPAENAVAARVEHRRIRERLYLPVVISQVNLSGGIGFQMKMDGIAVLRPGIKNTAGDEEG